MKPFFPLILIIGFCVPFLPTHGKMGLYLDSRYGGSALEIQSLDIDVSVVGNRAITTLDFVFKNQTNQILEGEFKFPLQEGQSVYRLALDVGTVLREASIVEKNKGREAFEQIARRKVDPALLEQTAGNLYTTHIYPIPALGTRRVVVGIEETLLRSQDAFQYKLPLLFSGMVGQFDLTVDCDSRSTPSARLGTQAVPFEIEDKHYLGRVKSDQLVPGQDIVLTLPYEDPTGRLVRLERDRSTGDVIFWAEASTQNPFDKERHSPTHITLLWDCSFSGIHRNLEQEKSLILEYLRKLPAATVELIPFHLEMDAATTFTTDARGLKALDRYLETLTYDGATRLNAISLSNHATDQLILVTDGVSTLGSQDPALPAVPTYALNSSVEADHTLLASLCRGTGGRYINLTRDKPSSALDTLSHLKPVVISAHTIAGKTHELFYGISPGPDTKLWVTGILPTQTAELECEVGLPNGRSETLSFELHRASAIPRNGIIQRTWARERFQHMNTRLLEERQAAIRFAMDQKIVTPLTSLIVLENVHDYVTYDVEPPSDLLADYKRIARNRPKSTFDPEAKLETVVRQWKRRVAWYETHFRKKAIELSHSEEETIEERSHQLAGAELSPPTRPSRGGPRNRNQVRNRAQDLNILPSRDTQRITQDEEGNQVFELSPFMVESSDDAGYMATQTLAGSRIRTDLRDIGDAISIFTEEFMEDTGATQTSGRSSQLSSHTTGTSLGNFADGAPAQEDQAKQGNSVDPTNAVPRMDAASPTIRLEEWDPDSTYHTLLAEVHPKKFLERYFELRASYGNIPAFYFDAASILFQHGENERAIRILSSIADLAPGEYLYQRAVGRTFLQMKAFLYGLESMQNTADQRKFEPQSFYDLGVAFAANGLYQEAVENFYHIITMPYSDRFNEIDVIALMELNRILANHGEALDTAFIDHRLIYAMPLDVRVTLSWNTDDTDIDLIVIDPQGNRCDYRKPHTPEGGLLSRDITAGYGPEEFILKKATHGTYKIQAHFFGSDEQGKKMPSVLYAQITRNFGQSNEETQNITVRLEDGDDVIYLGNIDFTS